MSKLVEQCGSYLILQMGKRGKGDYVVYNRHKPWKGGHTHLKGLRECYDCIKDVRHGIVPLNKSSYLLESRARLSKDEGYIKQCRSLAQSKKGKKEVDTDGRREVAKMETGND